MPAFAKQRKELVNNLKSMGYIKSPEIERAMLKVKREEFVPEELKADAYVDMPMPIPGGVTISAPHMHAIFLSALRIKPTDKVLEVGFGSGILLAYMRELTKQVVGIEFIPETFEFGKKNLEKAGYKDITLYFGDGSCGVPREAPFDKIVSGASAPDIPKPWIEQLRPGGVIVSPVGASSEHQELIYLAKTKDGKIEKKKMGGVVFVPLLGKHGFEAKQ